MASVEMSAELPPARTFLSPLLLCSLGLTAAIAVWGVVDNQGLAQVAREAIQTQFSGRAWFIMLTVSGLLLVSIGLACSRFGDVVLGQDGDQPEFSTISWLSMLFAAGMGVGLLYWGTAEPLTHYLIIKPSEAPVEPAPGALFITNFHWGFHAWAIYAMTGLVIAYFTFRRGAPSLVSAPLLQVYGVNAVTRSCGWLFDLLAIVAISIGLGGSIAMGIFQIEDGLQALFGVQDVGRWLTFTIFAVLCVCYVPPLMVDLGRGMSMLSNAALGIAILLLVFILLAGPTAYLMGGVVQGLGEYLGGFAVHGFRTFTFMDETVEDWFQSWTLTYMVWWLAWAPFVGVFIARISKGRTIREFLLGVIVVPTLFSILWFGVFGGIGFFSALRLDLPILDIVDKQASQVTFYVLQQLPAASLTIAATVLAAFLFLVTSVVSAAYVLGMFSTKGDLNPSPRIKLAWGIILGALGLVMVISDSIAAVKSIIALGAIPFVFIVSVLVVCLLRALTDEQREQG